MASKWTRITRPGTLHSAETWEGDRRRTSILIGEEGAPATSPDIVLWADTDHRVVVGQEVLMPDAPAQALADSLKKAISTPAPGSGPPRRPRRIVVKRAEVAEAVRHVAEEMGIRLEVAPSLPFVDDLYRDLEQQFGSPVNQGYLDATDLPEPLLAELFTVAAEYYRARPWKELTDGEPVLLECSDWVPTSRYAAVMGASGAVKGLALYESWRDLTRLARLSPDSPETEDVMWRTPAVALLYTKTSELGERRVQETRAHGWTIASRNAYPVVAGAGRGRQSHWPTPGEVRVLIAALRTLIPFTKAISRRRWRDTESPYVVEIHQVSTGGEEQELIATFPAPPRPLLDGE